MSKVDAHWELIPEIKKLRDEVAPDTPLTINGDIPDRQTGLKLAEQYGVDGIMIGRGIFHNPFAFEKEPRDHSSEELLDLRGRISISMINIRHRCGAPSAHLSASSKSMSVDFEGRVN